MATVADFQVISFADAKKRFPALAAIALALRDTVRVYDGDLVVDSFEGADLGLNNRNSCDSVIVDGDLMVSDTLRWSEAYGGSCLLVTGKISARFIDLDGAVWVQAALVEAKDAIIGTRGDDGGTIIADRVRAPLIVAESYFGIEADEIEGVALGDDIPGVDAIEIEDAEDVLRKDVFDTDTETCIEKLRGALAAGRAVLR